MSTKLKIQKIRAEIEAHEERGWLKGYEEGLAKREQEVSDLREALEARNEKIRELTSRKKSPKTAREALKLAWELAHPVREGQVWPDGAQGISKVNGELLTFTGHRAYPVVESDVRVARSLEPLPEPEPDWLTAPAVLAACYVCGVEGDGPQVTIQGPIFEGQKWECVECQKVTDWSSLSGVTPLYPKEDA